MINHKSWSKTLIAAYLVAVSNMAILFQRHYVHAKGASEAIGSQALAFSVANNGSIRTLGVAGDTCFVTDPTDSSLNVRNTPNGKVVDKIANNTEVIIKSIKKDSKGKAWAKVVRQGDKSTIGYVLLRYLQCP